MSSSFLFRNALPPMLLAKKLNNRAVFCIQAGHYNRAVNNLVKALKLTEQRADDEIGCTCRHCSLEACVSYSQKRGQIFDDLSTASKFNSDKSLNQDESSSSGYVHRQPILITSQAIQEDHTMGLTLPLIITFNLALVHHLSAISEEVLNRRKLGKVLQLYELAYRWQMESEEDEQVECIRFTLIISNNLGEIHRVVSNRIKYERCLQHVLSTLMFMVDCRIIDSESRLDMDGFLRNTSQIILQERCAAAA